MKKLLLSLLLSGATITGAIAQTTEQSQFSLSKEDAIAALNNEKPSFDTLGKFDSINTVIDPRTKKERLITNDELKNAMIIEVTNRLKEAGSTRIVAKDKVAVLPTMVVIPLTEADGIPFYTMVINRETGLTNNEYSALKKHENKIKENEAWEKAYGPKPDDLEKVKQKIAEYRKKNPKPIQTEMAPAKTITPSTNMYKPQAPARKINIK